MTGYVGKVPIGGVAWDYLQYVLGFAALGHDVYYYEDSGGWPYDPVAQTQTDSASYSVRFLSDFFLTHAPHLADRWRYSHLGATGYGMSDAEWNDVMRSADVFLNVSGSAVIPPELSGWLSGSS